MQIGQFNIGSISKIASKVIQRVSLSFFLVFSFAGCIAQKKSSTQAAYFTDSRDNHQYQTARIGSQTWMRENLNFATKDGSWCYQGENENCEKYGRLYDYSTAKEVCPEGWHLPTVSDWKKLRRSVAYNSRRIKSKTSGWPDPTSNNNSSGFSAVGSGLRDVNFHGQGYYTYRLLNVQAIFWCSSEDSASPDTFNISYSSSGWWGIPIFPRFESMSPSQGLAVRCVKNKK